MLAEQPPPPGARGTSHAIASQRVWAPPSGSQARPGASEGAAPHPARPAVRFPYAILEVKLHDGDSCPDWVLVSRSTVGPSRASCQHSLPANPPADPAPCRGLAPRVTSRAAHAHLGAPTGCVSA